MRPLIFTSILTIAATLLIFLFPKNASSEDTKAPAAPAAAAAQTVTYELRELRPSGITQYSNDATVRQYIEFQNEHGKHNILYEELSSSPPLRAIASLREMARSWDSSCALDMECTSKAFCTGECKNMYYEVANAPGDALSPDRAKCKIIYFSCERGAAVAGSSGSGNTLGVPQSPLPTIPTNE